MNGECRMKIQIFNRLIRHGESFRAPRSVQESIPVRKIYRDGVWLCGGRYSKMWRFQDVNYAVASEADQSEILMRYCSVINAWPDDAYVQVLTNNRRIDPVEFENTMLMHLRGDDMDRLREEYNQIVRERTEWSNNIFREKYIVKALIIESAKKTGRVVVMEEGIIVGGLGSAVAAALSEACPVPMRYIGMDDCFGQSGDAADLMEYYGMTVENTMKKVKELL